MPQSKSQAAKTRRRRTTTFDGLMAWNTLGLRWIEMMTAVPAVVAYRSARRNSAARLFRMGSEKAEAGVASANAMASRMLEPLPASANEIWLAWARLLQAGMEPYRSRALRNARNTRRKKRR